MKLLTLFRFIFCFITSSLCDDHLQQQWEQYKLEFGKSYSSYDEDLQRRDIFWMNSKMIDRHNQLHREGVYSYALGHNQFSDITHEEYLGKYHHHDLEVNPEEFNYVPSRRVLPSSFDWRRYGAVTEVKDEKSCGASWAFSAVGAVEGQLWRHTHHLESLSEQNLIDCTYNFWHRSCKSGNVTDAFNYIKHNDGLATNSSYPYKEKQHFFCNYHHHGTDPTVRDIVAVRSGNETALAAALVQLGPISVSVDARDHKFRFYKSGIYMNNRCSSTYLTRNMLLVGYGPSFWIIKNSWGRKWGAAGYMYLIRNRHNQCGVASRALIPIMKNNYSEKLISFLDY